MIAFDPENPFPLLAPGSHTYRDAQAHAAQVDAWLGFDCARVESALVAESAGQSFEDRPAQQRWVGLPVQALLTPYTEFRAMVEHLAADYGRTRVSAADAGAAVPGGAGAVGTSKAGGAGAAHPPAPSPAISGAAGRGGELLRIVDLGAGYGRMGIVIGRHYPQFSFLGIECVPERVAEGQRVFKQLLLAPTIELVCADITGEGFEFPRADIYFIYDFGDRLAIEQTLQSLLSLSLKQAVVVVGRGRATRDAIERKHPWLSAVVEPENFGNYSIYRSRVG